MPMLLNIQSSPNLTSSASRAASQAFIDRYVALHPDVMVVDIDLVLNPPVHIGTDHLGAFFAPPEFHSARNTAALMASEAYLAQLFVADIIVIGTPMHNLGIASVLKSWIDNVLRIGRTFKYNEMGIPVGLLPPGKKVVLVVAAGGIYSTGPMAQLEFAARYLTSIFNFMGVSDIQTIWAEGTTTSAAETKLVEALAAAEAMAALPDRMSAHA
jgi:FMN-dependent NADH-azoreductase